MLELFNHKVEFGQELVEFALILPLLLLLLLGIMEFGFAVFAYGTIANAAREVARYGIVHDSEDEIGAYVAANVARWTAGVDPDNLQVDWGITEGPVRATVNVTVTYDHDLITGPVINVMGGNTTLHLTSVATMNVE